MEPGVPFALLGAVQLLAIAAGIGLAAAALLRRTVPGALLALGALGLAAVEVDTALRLGDASSDPLALARMAGSLLLAVGLVTGGLGEQRLAPPPLYGVVVPLAAGAAPASLAGIASFLAAAAALRHRRDGVGVALAGGLVLWGAAALVSTAADTGSGAPLAVLLLRGAGALSVLVALGLLARASLLSKVVGAILAGVLAMAIAAVGVVGNVVVDSYEQQARATVTNASVARQIALSEQRDSVSNLADLLAALCQQLRGTCPELLRGVSGNQVNLHLTPPGTHDFLAFVPATGPVRLVAERTANLGAVDLVSLRQLPAVSLVLGASGPDKPANALATVARLSGASVRLAVLAASGVRDLAHPNDKPVGAYVYGQLLDSTYAQSAVDVGGYGLFLLAGDPVKVVASNASDEVGNRVLQIARRAGIANGLGADGLTVGSQGDNPTTAFRTLTSSSGELVGYVAITRDAAQALQAQRDALRLLVITALLALLAVAVIAAFLGRRTVEPVRTLTLAAQRIARGDLGVTTGVRTRDEVGTLARSFDDMTSSLGRLTGDLRDAAARLETVLASMSDGLLATDGQGVVTSVNRAALEMLGLEAEDVLGEPLDLVADVRGAAGEALSDVALLLRDEPADVHRPDGSRVPVRVAIGPLQGVDGVVMVLRDTTREREVERMKTEFLSNVSHELRTPLTPIRGYAEILVAKPGLDPAKVTQFATTIRDESLKMNRVVDLLVDVAALEAGRVVVFPRAVSARLLLDARLELWQRRAPGRAKDLKRRVAAGLPPLHVDPSWVGKALDELIDNAVKYTSPGTPITLAAALAPDGEHVRISVKDAGPGIAEDQQAGLFTSFEQVDGSATRRVGGLGLGLSFVRRLAEDAGFPLTVTSRLGRGSEFSLDLPASDEPTGRRTKG